MEWHQRRSSKGGEITPKEENNGKKERVLKMMNQRRLIKSKDERKYDDINRKMKKDVRSAKGIWTQEKSRSSMTNTTIFTSIMLAIKKPSLPTQ